MFRMLRCDKGMCGGGSKAPAIKPAPTPDPRPTFEPSEDSSAGQAASKAKRTKQYRSGFASTLKTGALGVQDDSKQTLGS